MVYGRRRTTSTHCTRAVPPDQWLWTPEPVHRAIITRQTWDTYVLRSRVRCRACKRRMYGATRATATGETVTYYLCPHSPANPRHAAQVPDHPRAVLAREDKLLVAIRDGFDERVFGPDRAARKDAEAARLRKRVKMIDAFEDAHTSELEALITAGATRDAITAMRTRHVARFTELEAERAQTARPPSAPPSPPTHPAPSWPSSPTTPPPRQQAAPPIRTYRPDL